MNEVEVDAADRTTVAAGCRVLGVEGITRATFGHVSMRTTEGRLLIKARGPGERALAWAGADDIVEIDAAGTVIDGPPGLSAPMETPIHTALYAHRADVGAVVHAHPRWVVALAAAGLQLAPIYGAYDPAGFVLASGEIAYFPRGVLIDRPELGSELADTIGDRRACILHGHGLVTVGPDVATAVATAVAIEELAHVTLLAAAAGNGVRGLSAPDQQTLRRQIDERIPNGPIAGPSSSSWRYYTERASR